MYKPRLPGPTLYSCEQYVGSIPRKEVIHRQVPLAMPCYDLLLIIDLTVAPANAGSSGTINSSELTGGEYKARERIHRNELIYGY